MTVTLKVWMYFLVKVNVHLRLVISLRVNVLNISYDEVVKLKWSSTSLGSTIRANISKPLSSMMQR